MSINQTELKEWLLSQFPPIVESCESEVTDDNDELLIILHLATNRIEGIGDGRKQAEQALIDHYRLETKALRIQLGREIGQMYGSSVTWGMRAGKTVQFFTNNMKPVMTRLSYQERRVLDTLIAANIAHTRSAALGYIVRTFATEHQDWLEDVQEALQHVDSLRDQLQPQRRKEPPIMLVSDQEE